MTDDLDLADGLAVGSIGDLLDAVSVRTARVVEVLAAQGGAGLAAETLLPGWTRRHVACHLRYGAESTLRMTLDALHGRATSRYPRGRPRQRPETVAPRPGEDGARLVRSVAATAAALERVWRDLRPDDWLLPVRPAATEDRRLQLTVRDLLVLRTTEIEVHGSDLDAGLGAWSRSFVTAGLPYRLERLDGRWPADDTTGSWLLAVIGGDTWEVHARTGPASARIVTGAGPPPVDSTIAGEPQDVLALLLGRTSWDRLTITGDEAAARAFGRAFPGP